MLYAEGVAVVLDDEALERIERSWWIFLVGGLVSVLFGAVLLTLDWTVTSVVFFYGAFLLFWGAFRIGVAFLFEGTARWILLGMGAVAAVLGLAAFAWPGPTLRVIAFLIGWWLIVTGTIDLILGLSGSMEPRWLSIVRGVVALLVGLWALWYPAKVLLVLIFVLGVMMVLYGVVEMYLAFQLRHLRRNLARWQAAALDRLATYAELLDRGLISEDEFDVQRRRLLGEGA